MTVEQTYTGDVQFSVNDDGDWDINYRNGQPDMTDGLDNAVLMSIFCESDTWQNDLTTDDSEKYISEFMDVIDRGSITDETIQNGIQAITKALAWMKTDSIAESIDVTGEAYSVYGLVWTIEINRGDLDNKYSVNWTKGILSIQKEVVA